MVDLREKDKEILDKLVSWAKEVLNRAEEKKEIYIELPVRTLRNVVFDQENGLLRMGKKKAKREFLNVAHAKRFLQTMLVAATVSDLLREGITASLRDVYYRVKHTIPGTHENTVDEQRETDRAIVDLETMLGFVREELHIFSKGGKGKAAGPFEIVEHVYTSDGKVRTVDFDGTNLGMGGWPVPPIVEPERVEIKRVDADFVLVIEKDAVWQRFHEDKFWEEHNCIIVTGSGQADRPTRRFVHRLHYEFNLPVYVLTDADPWGWYIYSVYKQGSINLSYLSPQLATPAARFLGMAISDYHRFNFDKTVKIKLKDVDIKRLNELRRYPWFKHKEWQEEFNLMEKEGFKMELEAGASKYFRFITKEYVPAKIENGPLLP